MEDITRKTGLTLGTLAQNNEVTGSAFRPWDNSSRTSEDLTSTHVLFFNGGASGKRLQKKNYGKIHHRNS